jgi:DnaJ-class molecular chaperone
MTGSTSASAANARICSDCDGFATVKVTLGGRDRHGHLRTITAHCPTCHGTGTRTARRLPTAAWEVAA